MLDAIGHIFLGAVAVVTLALAAAYESKDTGRFAHVAMWVVGAAMAIAASGVLTP